MATGNFYQRDSRKIYAVLMNETDEETGEEIYAEDYEVDDLKECLKEFMKEAKLNFDARKNEYYSDSLRSYPSSFLGTVDKYKMFGDVEVNVCLDILLTNAYYEGANLDYVIVTTVNGYKGEGNVELDDFWGSNMNKGLQVIQMKNAQKFLDKATEELRTKVESVFEQLSTPLVVTASFSNGETMYAKA